MTDLEKQDRENWGFEQRTPRQVILSETANREWLNKYEETYKAEFVKSFLENALKEGYAIQLNENFEVIDIRKVPLPRAIDIPEYVF